MAGGIEREKGFFTIYGLLLLTLILFLGAALFHFLYARQQVTRQFLLNTQLRMEAMNGIIIGCEYLSLHPEARAGLKNQVGHEQKLFEYKTESIGLSCQIYGVYKKNGDILLLAISTKEGKEDRALVRLYWSNKHAGYILDHWER